MARFCVRACLQQAQARPDQLDRAGERCMCLENLVSGRGWPDQLVIALEQSLFGAAEPAALPRRPTSPRDGER